MPFFEEVAIEKEKEKEKEIGKRKRLSHFWESLVVRGPRLTFSKEEIVDDKHLQSLRVSACLWGKRHNALIGSAKNNDGSISFSRVR